MYQPVVFHLQEDSEAMEHMEMPVVMLLLLTIHLVRQELLTFKLQEDTEPVDILLDFQDQVFQEELLELQRLVQPMEQPEQLEEQHMEQLQATTDQAQVQALESDILLQQVELLEEQPEVLLV